ncbi:response regulator [Poseidonibacter sp.]|uniref:response regulator n=1 Tax=Poseidonibacter sp. TaxID=2321188 RepID=UPI003C71E1AD
MLNNLVKDKNYEVMIVEDDSILAMGLESKLHKMGLTVRSMATTPEQAILHAQNNRPDLAIIDINLNASKTGIDVANYIWRNYNIPIIFLTSYYNDRIVNQAMESEPYAYLLKPCRDEELKVAINTTLHKHHFFFKSKESLNNKTEEFIYINENTKYDKTQCELFIDEKSIKLTKNEKKLFDILTK